MTRTFTSSTYALGAFLVAVFAGALGYFCLHEVGVVGQRPLTISKFPLFVLPPLALLSLGFVFAVGRAWVRVSVREGVVRIERRLRRTFECPVEGLEVSVRFVDSADATPGPRLVQDPRRSAAIRSAIRLFFGSSSLDGGFSRTPASEDFARLEFETSDGRKHVALLPGVSRLDELDDLREHLPWAPQPTSAASA